MSTLRCRSPLHKSSLKPANKTPPVQVFAGVGSRVGRKTSVLIHFHSRESSTQARCALHLLPRKSTLQAWLQALAKVVLVTLCKPFVVSRIRLLTKPLRPARETLLRPLSGFWLAPHTTALLQAAALRDRRSCTGDNPKNDHRKCTHIALQALQLLRLGLSLTWSR